MGYSGNNMSIKTKQLANKNPAKNRDCIHELFQTGNATSEYRIIRPDGSIWLHNSESIVYDQNGKSLQWGGVSIDITDKKLLGEQLRLKDFALQASPTAIGLADLNGIIFYANNAYIKLWGYNENEVIGKPVSDFASSQEQVGQVLSSIRQGDIRQGESVFDEGEYTRKDGTKFFGLISACIVKSDEGIPICLMVEFVDITERKQIEVEIKLKSEELIKINAVKDKFFSIIAHDLRSPFNGFLGLTELMAEGLSHMTLDDIQKIAVLMKNSATNLYRLLENLLEWSCMQRGLIPFRPSLFIILPKIAENMVLVLDSAVKKEIMINYVIPDNLMVFTDENMFGGIMRNLVSNAVKFTPKGGKIIISAKLTSDNLVKISIKDTGIGMSKALIDNLFRLDVNTNRKGTDGELSTGLGLIICKDFIEKGGGKLCVVSEPGRGTEFFFTLHI